MNECTNCRNRKQGAGNGVFCLLLGIYVWAPVQECRYHETEEKDEVDPAAG